MLTYQEAVRLIRLKIATAQAIRRSEPNPPTCRSTCPGWLDTTEGIERCDECCYVSGNKFLTVWDDEVRLLPETEEK